MKERGDIMGEIMNTDAIQLKDVSPMVGDSGGAAAATAVDDNLNPPLEFFNYHELLISTDTFPASLVVTHFPNNHATLDSLVYRLTRIVRIPRMYNTVRFSDIIPQFSTYVPGLEPAACVEDATTVGAQTEVLAATAGVKTVVPSFVARCRYDDNYFGDISLTPLVPSQMAPEELLPIITHINQILYEAYDPYSFYNFLDNVLDFVTGSLYSFLVNRVFGSYCRRKLSALEDYIDSVNSKFVSESRDIKFISPRRCGYLSIDIQIPKPVGGKSSSKI